MNIRLEFEKETKNTFRYQEIDEKGLPPENPILRTLYIRKSALPLKPDHITVTIEPVP